jgi:hypothetical protein
MEQNDRGLFQSIVPALRGRVTPRKSAQPVSRPGIELDTYDAYYFMN